MAILTGRYGKVSYGAADDTTGVPADPPVEILSVNTFKLSLKTEKEDVSCFGDENKVYIPGLKDISGSLGGFWNSAELALFHAADAAKPGMLQLMPNDTQPTFYWQGLAYLDADIDCTLQAPKVTGTFAAAGPWEGPDGHGAGGTLRQRDAQGRRIVAPPPAQVAA